MKKEKHRINRPPGQKAVVRAVQRAVEKSNHLQVFVSADTDSIIEDEDINVCRRELAMQEKALSYHQHIGHAVRLFAECGVSIQQIANAGGFNFSSNNENTDYSEYFENAHPGKLQQRRKIINSILKILGSQKTLFDPDWLEGNEDEPLLEKIAEYNRARKESTALIGLQIDWLTDQAKSKLVKPPPILEDVPEASASQSDVLVGQDNPPAEVAEIYHLVDWNLFWVNQPWSINPNHWEEVANQSRQATIDDVIRLGRKSISIKASSIVRAVEFHLRKDVIEKALATRIKYAPEDQRDWVKIKRGRDRIGVLVLPEQKVGFFAEGRDIVYESLR